MGGEAERELAACGVSHHHNSARSSCADCVLQKELMRGTDIGERPRPCPAFVADAPEFQVRRCQSFGSERRTQVARVIEIIFRAPVAAVNIDDEDMAACCVSFDEGSRKSRN